MQYVKRLCRQPRGSIYSFHPICGRFTLFVKGRTGSNDELMRHSPNSGSGVGFEDESKQVQVVSQE